MNSTTSRRSRTARRAARNTGDRVAQAVRNSLNLSDLRVRVRRGPERGCWQAQLQLGPGRSEWLGLNPAAVAVIKKITLLPPRLLGKFRLAYDSLKTSQSRDAGRRNSAHSERRERTADDLS